jgi:ABC-2 type transport system ATP-binding protein
MSTRVNKLSTNGHRSVLEAAPVIEATGLRKQFGDIVAVDDLSFSVPAGTILGLLGPNGAGKTTTIKMLTTLLPIEGGSAVVAGYDVATEAPAVRRYIGLAGQSAAVDDKLSVWQNLDLFGRLYHMPGARRSDRVRELVERFEMSEYADRVAGTLSGGERRRLDLVAALVADPPAVFLDEPTAGLDPRGRQALWEQIAAIRDGGTAIVLTTQYLEEVDRLADNIVVIDRGVAVASGTADELKAQLDRDVFEVTLVDAGQRDAALAAMGTGGVNVTDARTLHLSVTSASDSLASLRRLDQAGIAVADFQLRRPTLDDVFIEITGQPTIPANEREVVGA